MVKIFKKLYEGIYEDLLALPNKSFFEDLEQNGNCLLEVAPALRQLNVIHKKGPFF